MTKNPHLEAALGMVELLADYIEKTEEMLVEHRVIEGLKGRDLICVARALAAKIKANAGS